MFSFYIDLFQGFLNVSSIFDIKNWKSLIDLSLHTYRYQLHSFPYCIMTLTYIHKTLEIEKNCGIGFKDSIILSSLYKFYQFPHSFFQSFQSSPSPWLLFLVFEKWQSEDIPWICNCMMVSVSRTLQPESKQMILEIKSFFPQTS